MAGKTKVFYSKKNIQLFILAFPALLAILIFNYIPMSGIFIAFKNINYEAGIFKSPWVGFRNFVYFFTSNDAWSVIRNTLGYNAANIFIGTAIAVIFALMLNEIARRRFVSIYQTVFFFPFFFSWIVVEYMVYSFMSMQPSGVLITIFKAFGIDMTTFYIDPGYWPPFMVFLGIWKNLGYTTVIYFAAIMGLSKDYFEAAIIDGASKLKTIRYVTLPLIAPVITIMVLLSIGKIFYSDFGLFYFVPRGLGQLIPVTQTIDTYVFRMLQTTFDMGRTAAAGLFQSLMSFIVVMISNYIVKSINPENSVF